VTGRQIERAEALRFKRRSDLVNFASRHPGALGALFLHQLRVKLNLGPAHKLGDLYHTDITTWAATSTGLKETRDLREVQALSKVLLEINKDNLPQAVDIIAQRIREIKAAKSSGGSWEKAELVSLLPCSQPGSSMMADASMAL